MISSTALIFQVLKFSEDQKNNSSTRNFLQMHKDSLNLSVQYPCLNFPNRTLFAHHGGNITKHQEKSNPDIWINLMQVGTGEIIAFHDENSLEKTGVSLEIRNSFFNLVKNLSYLKKFENRVYAERAEIPLLKKAINSICAINNRTSLWFDIKYAFDNEFVTRT